ncbi:hypothetical protein B6259_04820 [Ruminococcaceae bacterium CPB6]|nr:hypothetical protein B6259_04820 [Ruminococcaceae bacterium CPB6]
MDLAAFKICFISFPPKYYTAEIYIIFVKRIILQIYFTSKYFLNFKITHTDFLQKACKMLKLLGY